MAKNDNSTHPISSCGSSQDLRGKKATVPLSGARASCPLVNELIWGRGHLAQYRSLRLYPYTADRLRPWTWLPALCREPSLRFFDNPFVGSASAGRDSYRKDFLTNALE